MHQVFSTIQVTVTPANNSRLITWKLHPRFKPTATPSFYVEIGQSAGPWIRRNGIPIVNDNTYIDIGPYLQDARTLTYYRVVMVMAEQEYASTPTGVRGTLSPRERQLMKEVLRRNYLNMYRNTGSFGYLLRRREWGVACSCADPDLGMAASASCPQCHGTGFEQGYYAPCPYWLEVVQEGPRRQTETGQVGVKIDQTIQFIGINYPTPAPNDIWVDSATGDRYIIEGAVEPVVAIRSTPVLLGLAKRKLPVTDSIYSIPFDLEDTGSWTTGIATF